MSGFYIYDVSELSDAEISAIGENDTELDNPVELGLSAGEVRQAILDRVRQEVEEQEFAYVDTWFPEDIEITSEMLEDGEACQNAFVRDVGEALYSTDDTELDGRVFTFSSEAIVLRIE